MRQIPANRLPADADLHTKVQWMPVGPSGLLVQRFGVQRRWSMSDAGITWATTSVADARIQDATVSRPHIGALHCATASTSSPERVRALLRRAMPLHCSSQRHSYPTRASSPPSTCLDPADSRAGRRTARWHTSRRTSVRKWTSAPWPTSWRSAGHGHDERWGQDLLQGLGQWAAHRVLAWLAVVR